MLTGTTLGPYRILEMLGSGGMGQVYRARDTTLNRDVALKVLPDSCANDPERLARFKREAQTLASLNHPNIAHLYGLETQPADPAGNSAPVLVMELVEGEDLAQRLIRGPIPIAEALAIARQIAYALEAAHEQGIVHRDLKPANIKLRADGTAKVLDFGLAKLTSSEEPSPGSAGLSQSPTMSFPLKTREAVVLGTAPYMSPEQAKGRAVDKRADVWAFGAVLFEMLTGARAFEGESLAETMAAVIHKDPPWSRLPADTPPSVTRVLQRCLSKEPKERLRDIGDVRLTLDDAFLTAPERAIPAARTASIDRRAWIAVGVAVAGMIALAIPAVRHLGEMPPPAPPETRVDITTPATTRPASFELSPDGRHVVFVASGDGAPRLWLRSLAATTAEPLAGTEGANSVFWSPDGRSIGFFTGTALKALDLDGGAARTLAPVVSGRGTWNADGVIVFSPTSWGPLMRIPAAGGTPSPVTTVGPQQTGHFAPRFLPDGRRFLFYAGGAPDSAGIYLGAIDGGATRLTAASDGGVYLPATPDRGWLLWTRPGGQTLVAQNLDLATPALTGEPITVADDVIGVSVGGTLVAYRTGVDSPRQLTWMDRSGQTIGTVGDEDRTQVLPRLSRDGRRVAVNRLVEDNRDIWLLDDIRASRFTFGASDELAMAWAPDGGRLAFNSPQTGQYDLYVKRTNGDGEEERLVVSDQNKVPTSWSSDGRFIMYFSIDPESRYDLWVVPMDGDRTPFVYLKTPFAERNAVFSPDGRWVAYESDESGRNEVYVRPFVPPGSAADASRGGQWPISTAGGIMPAWRADGRELYYLNPDGAMMAVPIAVNGSTLEPGVPVLLFPTRIFGGGVDAQQGRQYDVASDGRFLVNVELERARDPITLVMHWNPGARR